VYAGLEEVFESANGGSTWVTASPYWNYTLACESTTAGCPNTTHPDQHAMMITDGKIVIGNDGGVYSRPLSDTQQYGDWTDLNATLRSWQYYDARAGRLPGAGTAVWGGLQDNGTSLVTSRSSQMVEPAGGDGFDVIVDPQNANNMVGEYTDGTMYSSTDGGHSFSDTVSPTCAAQATAGLTPRPDCDPAARFVTPLVPDQGSKDVWVTGGQYVWVTADGWNTSCTDSACSWKAVYNTGAGHAVTALSSARGGGGGRPHGRPGWLHLRRHARPGSLADRLLAPVWVSPGGPAAGRHPGPAPARPLPGNLTRAATPRLMNALRGFSAGT